MSFDAQKILDSDITDKDHGGVQTQPNKLTGSAADNKKVFDRLIEDIVKPKFNALIDELIAQTAAEQIGCSATGVASTNVNDALTEIYALISPISQGDVPNYSITHVKLSSNPPAVQNDNLSGILPEYVGIKMGPDVPTTDDISEGQIYLKYSIL